MCAHPDLEVHVFGESTVIACADCLQVVDHDIAIFDKSGS